MLYKHHLSLYREHVGDRCCALKKLKLTLRNDMASSEYSLDLNTVSEHVYAASMGSASLPWSQHWRHPPYPGSMIIQSTSKSQTNLNGERILMASKHPSHVYFLK